MSCKLVLALLEHLDLVVRNTLYVQEIVGGQDLIYASTHVPAFDISCPGVIFLCAPTVNSRMLDLLSIKDNASSTLLGAGILRRMDEVFVDRAGRVMIRVKITL